MFATLVLGLLAHADDRSIVDKMSSPRATVPLLSNPGRQISSEAKNQLSWSAFRGAWRENIGDVQTGVTLDQSKHSDFFSTAALAKRVVDNDLKVDAQVTHDFHDQNTKLDASLLTKDGTRISGDIDRNMKVGRVEVSKSLNDLPLSKQLGDRLTLSPSLAVENRELTLEIAQDIGEKNMLVPSVSLNSDGSLNRWGVGWMSRLNNGDALAARLDADNKLDVRYDRQCDDGSQWRLNANVPSLGGSDVISNTEWSVTRAWSK